MGVKVLRLIKAVGRSLIIGREDRVYYSLSEDELLEIRRAVDNTLKWKSVMRLVEHNMNKVSGEDFKYLGIEVVNQKIDRAGVVYVISNGNDGLYKIGMTKRDVTERYNDILSSNPTAKLICHYEVCDIKIEKDLHRHFKPKRFNREWFKLSDEEVLSIGSLVDSFSEKYRNK